MLIKGRVFHILASQRFDEGPKEGSPPTTYCTTGLHYGIILPEVCMFLPTKEMHMQ